MSKLIPLTRGKFTLVDDADYDYFSQNKWYALKGKKGMYAARRNDRGMFPRIVLMHRIMLQAPDGIEVDHINQDSLDNQRVNLRLATKSQNGANTRRFDEQGREKRYRGVWFYQGRWVAGIKVNKKNLYLGRYMELYDALIAYNTAALFHFGEFAKLNPLDNVSEDRLVVSETPTQNKYRDYQEGLLE